jgi:hypothetical protein
MSNKQTTRIEGDVYITTSSDPLTYGDGSLVIDGTLTVTGGITTAHSGLTGLLNDDHTQYSLLAGRSGGQILIGGVDASNTLILRSTSNATKGQVYIDETTASTSTITGALRVAGGVGIAGAIYAGNVYSNGVLLGTSSYSQGTNINITGLTISVISNPSFSGITQVTNATVSTTTSTGALVVTGGVGIGGALFGTSATFTTLTAPHSGLSGLLNDEHTQYTLLAGRSGGQTITGGTVASNTLILRSTSNATKGQVFIDETTTSTSTTTGALRVGGGVGIAGALFGASATFTSLSAPHSGLSGLLNDEHTQYTLLAGRSGGQTITGGTAASNTLILRSTSNATKGQVYIDETTASTSTITGALRVGGGVGIAGALFGASATFTSLSAPHSGLSGLLNDEHTQYTLLAGRSGGQTITGGTAASNTLILRSTSNATKGQVFIDETTASTNTTTGALVVTGGVGIGGALFGASATFTSLSAPHSGLSGLTADDHTQYTLLVGRSGGQTITGGTAASNTLVLRSTSNATKGQVYIDETTTSTSTTTGALRVGGGVGITGALFAGDVTTGSTTFDRQVSVPQTITTSTNGNTTLTASSATLQFIVGSGENFSIILPNSTSIAIGYRLTLINTTLFNVTIYYNDGVTLLSTLLSSSKSELYLRTNGTQNGGWEYRSIDLTTALALEAKEKVDTQININEVTFEPTGFENRTDSTFSFTNATRTFTIQPVSASFNYWIAGVKYTVSTAKTVVISDVEGLHFIYFNGVTLTDDPSPPNVSVTRDVAFVAILYWDLSEQVSIYLGEERHGITMDWVTHSYLHATQGSRYESGFGLGDFSVDGDGSTNANSQFSVSDGIFWDEDIKHIITDGSPQNISPIVNCAIFYRHGTANWAYKAANSYPLIISGESGYTGTSGLPAYNFNNLGSYSLEEVADGSYFNIYYFATNDMTYPIIGVLGIGYYSTVTLARDAVSNEFGNITGLPFLEFITIGAVIFQVSSAFTNTTKAIVVSSESGNYIDLRDISGFKIGSAANYHGSLGGLSEDHHHQYLLVDGTRAMGADLHMDMNRIIDVSQLITTPTQITTTLNGNTTLTLTSNGVINVTGTATGFSITLPNCTTGIIGTSFDIYNNSSVSILVRNNTGSTLISLQRDSSAKVILQINGTQNGSWSIDSIQAGTGLTKIGNTISVDNALTNVTSLGTLSSLNVTGTVNIDSLTASVAVFTNASKNLISVGLNGSGNVVLTTSPTLVTPILGVASATSLSLTSTTDATSSTVGGTLTVAGGGAFAKKVFIGTDLSVTGSATFGTLVAPHSGFTGLLNDDHTQYALLAGRSGGQTITGGTAASNTLILRSTSNATKGQVFIDETTVSTSTTTGALRVAGGVGIGGSLFGASATFTSLSAPHSGLSGLLNDDHTQYTLLVGRSGGQTITGGTAASNTLILRSTSNATKGQVFIDETTASTSTTTGALRVAGGVGIGGALFGASATFTSLSAPHSGLSGLTADDHTQYALLAGRSGGQTITGGTAASNTLILRSTSNATKGQVFIDETTASTSTTTGALRVAGGVGIGGALYAGDIYSNGLLVGSSSYTPGTNIDITSSIISVIANPSFSGITQVTNATSSTSTTTGALVVTGGVGIGNSLFIGSNAVVSNYIQTNNITTPANPAASNYRIFFNTSTNLLSSINSAGSLTTYQPTTTKGDITSHDGTTQGRLPIGNNNDRLIADSTQSLGLRWVPSFTCFYIRDEKTTGTNGGTIASGSFVTRTLNTITVFPVGNTTVTLSANIVTFAPGSYYIYALCPAAGNIGDFTTRLIDNVSTALIKAGSTSTSLSNNGSGISHLQGMVTFVSTTQVALQMRVTSTVATTGLGNAHGFQTEIYSIMNVHVLQS